MINPEKITNFQNTLAGQEEFLLFAICVAGKNAKQQAKKLQLFLDSLPKAKTPFERIRRAGSVRPYLELARMGQYTRISRAFESIANSGLDLAKATTAELERVPGVGLKTSRFFVLHSRPAARVACLDTHILRYMREKLQIPTPKSTPTSTQTYRLLEAQFLAHCDDIERDVAEYDLEIWNTYASHGPRDLSTSSVVKSESQRSIMS